MATSAHPLASLAGARMLLAGGNAFDAAVAVASTLNVVEPYMSGIAGNGYMLLYSAKDKTHRVIDYLGTAPYAATLDVYPTLESQQIGHSCRYGPRWLWWMARPLGTLRKYGSRRHLCSGD